MAKVLEEVRAGCSAMRHQRDNRHKSVVHLDSCQSEDLCVGYGRTNDLAGVDLGLETQVQRCAPCRDPHFKNEKRSASVINNPASA